MAMAMAMAMATATALSDFLQEASTFSLKQCTALILRVSLQSFICSHKRRHSNRVPDLSS